MNFTVAGALLGALSVILGAFGAHALRGQLTPAMQSVYETAVRYQFLHAFALLFVGRAGPRAPQAGAGLAGWLFAIGVVLFSGSLYALVFTGTTWWGAVTPLGGLALIAGWLVLARAFWGRGHE
jgi:uncharacterized membrane protein YgdD (TMEM256/DUF423 family)